MLPASVLRMLSTALLAASLLAPTQALSLVIVYTDRATWEADALTAGLSIVTEDFSTDPGAAFTLGGVDFTNGGTHDAVGERLLSGPIAAINFTGGTVFGIGADFDNAFGPVSTVNLRGVDVSPDFGGLGLFAGDLPSFIGILADVELDPACPGIPCIGGSEILMSGQGATSSASLDNLSVAVVPEPALGLLVAAAACVAVRRRVRR